MPQIVGFLLIHVQCETTIFITGLITLFGTFSSFLLISERKPRVRNSVSEETPLITSETKTKSAYDEIVELLDLDLLMDKDFLLRVFGISCGFVVCADFDLIFPFFLKVCAEMISLSTDAILTLPENH
jgi:hypothetical protein